MSESDVRVFPYFEHFLGRCNGAMRLPCLHPSPQQSRGTRICLEECAQKYRSPNHWTVVFRSRVLPRRVRRTSGLPLNVNFALLWFEYVAKRHD